MLLNLGAIRFENQFKPYNTPGLILDELFQLLCSQMSIAHTDIDSFLGSCHDCVYF